jgi:hypothetical protein
VVFPLTFSLYYSVRICRSAFCSFQRPRRKNPLSLLRNLVVIGRNHFTFQLLGAGRRESVWKCGGTTPLIVYPHALFGRVTHLFDTTRGLCGGQSGTWRGFSEFFDFLVSAPLLRRFIYSLMYLWGMYSEPVSGRISTETVWLLHSN